MKLLFYLGLVMLLVPLQTILLPYVSLWGIKPDVGLVVAALIGLFGGELEGLLVGLAIGWMLNMYSAGPLWLSVVINGGAGLFAGLLGRQVAQVTPTILCVGLLAVSLAGGLVAAFSIKNATLADTWWMFQSMVVPQACFDAILGVAAFMVIQQRYMTERLRLFSRYS